MSLWAVQQRARRGEKEAQYQLGEIYHYGWGVKVNRMEAERWLMAAAKQGHTKAICLVWINYLEIYIIIISFWYVL